MLVMTVSTLLQVVQPGQLVMAQTACLQLTVALPPASALEITLMRLILVLPHPG
jgi:hypothetical protein